MATLYDELGVASDATPDELRSAYRERARQLHPDVNPGAHAEEAIRRLNEAWTVLGNPSARRRYDDSLRSEHQGATFATAHIAYGEGEVSHSILRSVARPSVLVLAVLAIIFVVTAYAGHHPGQPSSGPTSPSSGAATSLPVGTGPQQSSLVGKCLLIQPGYDAVGPCNQPNSGQVVAEVAQLSQCPAGSTGYQLTGRAQLVCLVASR